MFRIQSAEISRDELIRVLQNPRAGALVVFEGWVRDHNEGKAVSSLEYQVYEALAKTEGEKILEEACRNFNLHQALCVHRQGHLRLGETAVWIGVVASHRDDAYQASRYVIDQIKLRLPIWKKEHYLNHDAVWVQCQDHATHVHFEEADYYAKQAKIVQQELLTRAKVLVVGAGGLGCPVLTSLAAAGVGKISFVDFDSVSISNIHRQPLYSPESVGEKKVVIAQNRLLALNPFITLQGHDARVTHANVDTFILGRDLVIDCTDNLETKFLLHDACFKLGVPLISASIHQFEGQVRTFIPSRENGCLRCLFPETPDDALIGNCNDFGVLGASVGAIGQLQAHEALLFLLQGTNSTAEATFYLNLKDLSQMKIANFRREGCACCEEQGGMRAVQAGGVNCGEDESLEIDLAQLGGLDHQLVDIREINDTDLEIFLHSCHESESAATAAAQKKIVLYCHRGIRSRHWVKEQRALGHSQVYSLRGGACSL